MTNYRRTHQPGATWFFTVNLAERRSRLLVDRIDTLREALRYVQSRHPFRIDAMVVLPDHVHAIWTLPPGDSDYPLRWRLLKTWFSRHIPHGERRRPSQVEKGERGIWQRRYWERLIRDEADLHSHIDYIHFNPVKHGHALRAVDWPYSTFHRYVREGILSADWGVATEVGGSFGERADRPPNPLPRMGRAQRHPSADKSCGGSCVMAPRNSRIASSCCLRIGQRWVSLRSTHPT